MKLYTDKQISEILEGIDSFKKEFGDERYNNIRGEWLSQTVLKIEKILLSGDKIRLEATDETIKRASISLMFTEVQKQRLNEGLCPYDGTKLVEGKCEKCGSIF